MLSDKSEIGKKIAQLRHKHGLTQLDLAKQLGLKTVTISGWECGKVDLPLSRVISLCSFFNLTLDQFLEITLIPSSSTQPIKSERSKFKRGKAREIARKLDLLTKKLLFLQVKLSRL